MTSFTVRTVSRRPAAALFDAALDLGLHTASQARSGERVVRGPASGQLGLGDEVTWRARHLGLWWTMTAAVTEFERPTRFVDEQVRGPFSSFRHEHRFEEHESGTSMTDTIEFTAPLGVPGRAVAALVLRPYLRRLIARRGEFLAHG
ncbi:SRPBCC family protein [Aeromicrobium sp. YIM 150415]|uniref:SRPBCC family protein n=1 Tax=Aeromicrobium sp. YIM 150415 TaxID=2803912 RepID=UPI001963D227|nr:SRPBCC family protein [Aeromicrobium sp. YIM 150415]MBM9463268.1 SRPBCC family protein [Aeromicrobium sp. YIM 150415]